MADGINEILNGRYNILLFDGVCNLCNGFVQFTIKRDRKNKFKFAALQSEPGQQLLNKLNLSTQHFDTFVYIRGDHYYVRSTAVLNVVREFGGMWKLFYVFIIIPRFLRDAVYNLVARTRYRIFGRRETCMVPTPELKQKFLD